MPGKDGTGPNGNYERCSPKGYEPNSSSEPFYRGRGQGRGFGYQARDRQVIQNQDVKDGGLEKVVGTGLGPCGNGIPRGRGRRYQA